MINWKKVGEHIPSNAGEKWEHTPYLPCIVWSCHPETGVKNGIRTEYDTKELLELFKQQQ